MSADRRVFHMKLEATRRSGTDRRHDDTRAIVVERRGTGIVEHERLRASLTGVTDMHRGKSSFRWQPFERRVANTYTATDFDRRVRKGHLNRRKPQDPGVQGRRIQAGAERRGMMVPTFPASQFLVDHMVGQGILAPGTQSGQSEFDKRRAGWTRERRQSTRLNMTDFHRRETDDRVIATDGRVFMRIRGESYASMKDRVDAYHEALQVSSGERLRKDLEAYARGFSEKVYDRDGAAPPKALNPKHQHVVDSVQLQPGETLNNFKERTAARIFNAAYEHGDFSQTQGRAKRDDAHAEFQQARLKTIALDLKRDINQLFDHVIEGPSRSTNDAGEKYVVLGLSGAVGSEQQLFDSMVAMCKVLRLCGMLAIKPDGEPPAAMRPCPVLHWRRDPEFTYEDSVWSDPANDFQSCEPYIKVTVRLVASQVMSANMNVAVEKRSGQDRRGDHTTVLGRRAEQRRQS